jgi:hypothetical protein
MNELPALELTTHIRKANNHLTANDRLPTNICSFHRSVFFKLWSADHRWSPAVLQVVRGGSQAILEEKRLSIIILDTERMKNTPIHICAKTVFFGWTSTESRRNSSCPSIIILENTLNWCIIGYGNLNHQCNVSPIHLHALLDVGNFTNVVRVCANRLWSVQLLPKVWETLLYIRKRSELII